MTSESLVFLAVATLAFSVSGYKLSILVRLLRAQKGVIPARTGLGARITTTIVNVLGQKAVLADKKAGIMHATIFWGFMVITIGTLEQFASTLIPGTTFEFIGEVPYSLLVWLQDVLTAAVLVAVIYAFYRRLIVRPAKLGQSFDANLILTLTGSLMVSILLMNAFFILGTGDTHPMPVSKELAAMLGFFGLSAEDAMNFSRIFKWIHMLIVLGFGVYIPSSKHLHVLAAGPNTFFKTLDRAKGMRTIDFENSKLEQYGAGKITDLSWKDTLDYYSCTECGRCQELCPAWNTQKPLSPKRLIIDLKENLYHNKDAILKGQNDKIGPVLDKNITEDVIWACTSCRACEIACPVFIEHTDKIFDIRRNLVMMESKFPAEVQTVFKNMETNGTPWAFSSADRANWSEGLSIPKMSEKPAIDVLLWVGCAGAYDERNKKVLRSFASVLKKAGIRFAILGTEETCTGDAARRIGNEYLYQTLAKANVATLNKHEVKSIVTACPHCFNTIKNEYKDFGGNYEVFHHTQFIAKLIKDGKIKPSKSFEEKITFHDSCYLGRWNGIYDEPREIISSIPSAQFKEIEAHHDKSMCCGAGGGRMWMEEKIGDRVNIKRTEQALATQAGIITSSCPFCMTMLGDGLKSKDMQDKVKVMDLAELIDQSTL